MKPKKPMRKFRTSITTKCKLWCNYKIPINHPNYCCKGKNICTNFRDNHDIPTPLPRALPRSTYAHIANSNDRNPTYRMLNIDICIELAKEHASDVDMTFAASQHKSRASTLTTYNKYTSDQHLTSTHQYNAMLFI